MTEATVLKLFAEAFLTAALVSAPMLLVALVIGVVISLLQAVTQIQEFTLTFVPKILGVFAAILVFGPLLLTTLVRYTARLLMEFPSILRGGL